MSTSNCFLSVSLGVVSGITIEMFQNDCGLPFQISIQLFKDVVTFLDHNRSSFLNVSSINKSQPHGSVVPICNTKPKFANELLSHGRIGFGTRISFGATTLFALFLPIANPLFAMFVPIEKKSSSQERTHICNSQWRTLYLSDSYEWARRTTYQSSWRTSR